MILPFLSFFFCLSRRWIVLDDGAHALLISLAILLEQLVRISLGGRVDIGLVEQLLDAEQDLLDGNRRLPALLFIEDGQAHGAGWVDIWVEERRRELALRRLCWVLYFYCLCVSCLASLTSSSRQSWLDSLRGWILLHTVWKSDF